MNPTKHLAVYLWFLTMIVVLVSPAQPHVVRSPFCNKEFLQYKVKWNFIRLGTVTIVQENVASNEGQRTMVQMSVRSAAGLPFINVRFVHTAIVPHDQPTLEDVRILNGGDSTNISSFVHRNGVLVLADTLDGKGVRLDSVRWEGRLYEAISLLMIARALSASKNVELTLPTLVGYEIGYTDLTFSGRRERLEVDALENGISSLHISGVARWSGESFAGMSGEFEAWISDDEAAVPLRAEVDIFLGSIVLELESFECAAWFPTSPGFATMK